MVVVRVGNFLFQKLNDDLIFDNIMTRDSSKHKVKAATSMTSMERKQWTDAGLSMTTIDGTEQKLRTSISDKSKTVVANVNKLEI